MTREEEIRQAAINHICDDTEQLLVLFEEGAKWADETMIDKACEWLRRNYTNYMVNDLSKYVEDVCSFDIFDDLLVDDFRKAMEEK